MRQLAGYTVQQKAELSISRRFFCVFQSVSHFASVFMVVLPTLDFVHMPA